MRELIQVISNQLAIMIIILRTGSDVICLVCSYIRHRGRHMQIRLAPFNQAITPQSFDHVVTESQALLNSIQSQYFVEGQVGFLDQQPTVGRID
jgi:hypothetical protein